MTTTRREAGSRGGCYGRARRTRLISPRALFVLVVLVGALEPLPAMAHPLGNFSISHYSGIHIGKDAIEVRYIIDMAEIPTFQEVQETGIVAEARHPSLDSYLARKAEDLKAGLILEINGSRFPLKTKSKEVLFTPGAGALPTMKIGVLYKGKLDERVSVSTPYRLYYRDGNFPERAGWKEIIGVAANGAKLLNSSVPEVDRSAGLSDYPTDLLNSPPQALEARVNFALLAGPVSKAEAPAANPAVPKNRQTNAVAEFQSHSQVRKQVTDETANVKAVRNGRDRYLPAGEQVTDTPTPAIAHPRTESNNLQLQANRQSTPRDSFTELMATKQLGWSVILITLAVAAGLGAFHALEPGHGKTLVAAYLVGSRGTVKHAVLLGLIVTAAHTAGVYLLGAVTLYASQYIVPDKLYPWLALASGVMILSLGLVLFVRRYRGTADASRHPHRAHDHYHHEHAHHSHDSDPIHHHLHGGRSRHHHELDSEISLRQLLALGVSGGIVPCPAALVVLLTAVSMRRDGFGWLLTDIVSVGLAAVLIGIGLLMVYAQRFLARFTGSGQLTTHWLPLASSAFIVLIGVALTWQALQSAGFQILAPL